MGKLRLVWLTLSTLVFSATNINAQFRNTHFQLQASPSTNSFGQGNLLIQNGGFAQQQQNGNLKKFQPQLQQQQFKNPAGQQSQPQQQGQQGFNTQFQQLQHPQQSIPSQQQQQQQENNGFSNNVQNTHQQATGLGLGLGGNNLPRGGQFSGPGPNNNVLGGGRLRVPNTNDKPEDSTTTPNSPQSSPTTTISKFPANPPTRTRISFSSLPPPSQQSQQVPTAQQASTLTAAEGPNANGQKQEQDKQKEEQGSTATTNQFSSSFPQPNSNGLASQNSNLPSSVPTNSFRLPAVNSWNGEPHKVNGAGAGIAGDGSGNNKFSSHRFKVQPLNNNNDDDGRNGRPFQSSFETFRNQNPTGNFRFPPELPHGQHFDPTFGQFGGVENNQQQNPVAGAASTNINIVHVPEKQKNTVKKGTFSWTSPEGQVYDVTYIADSSKSPNNNDNQQWNPIFNNNGNNNNNNPNTFAAIPQITNNLESFGSPSSFVPQFVPR